MQMAPAIEDETVSRYIGRRRSVRYVSASICWALHRRGADRTPRTADRLPGCGDAAPGRSAPGRRGFEGGINIRNRLPGAATPPGPTSISPAQLDHVARGDTAGPNSPNTATVMGPNGHPIIVEGFYRPNGAGGFDI